MKSSVAHHLHSRQLSTAENSRDESLIGEVLHLRALTFDSGSNSQRMGNVSVERDANSGPRHGGA